MLLRVPMRALLLGSAVLLGRLFWSRVRKGRRASEAQLAEDEESFPDTVPAFWSRFHEQAPGGDARP